MNDDSIEFYQSSSSEYLSDYELNSQDESQENDRKINQKENNIICIELMNNNKIYLNYSLNWKVRDVNKNKNLKNKSFLFSYLKTFLNIENLKDCTLIKDTIILTKC